MGLPDAALDRDRGQVASKASAADDCLDILTRLLSGLGPAEAPHWAARLLDEFGTLGATLAAGPAAHARVLDARADVVAHLLLLRNAFTHSLRTDLHSRPLLGNMDAVLLYLGALLVHDRREQLRVLFLDAGTHLIRDEMIGRGTLDQAPIYPREILGRALELGAAGIILVHNHPSGNPTPSRADIEVTQRIVGAAKILNVKVHDHLIIARGGYVSLRKAKLI